MTRGFGLYLWCILFLHMYLLLFLLRPLWLAQSPFPYLFQSSFPNFLAEASSINLLFPSTILPLYITPHIHPSSNLPFNPLIHLLNFSLFFVFLCLLHSLLPLSAPLPSAILCLETSSLSSAAFLHTSISVWLVFIPSVHSSIPLAACLPGHRLDSLLAQFSLGLNVIANVPAWQLQLCV